MSATELGVLARAGDAQALAALLEQSRASLYATAVMLLGNRPDALDAVQETCVVALLRLDRLRDAGAARAWLHTVVRNVCLARIRQRREIPAAEIRVHSMSPGPEQLSEQAFQRHALREWVWHALELLSPEEQMSVILRYFTRSASYEAIAQTTGVPVGTVRSRLHRARTRMADTLLSTAAGTESSNADRTESQRTIWEEFYRTLHECPAPRTYRDLFATDVEVRDTNRRWHGIADWSAEERQAISLGVRASLVNVLSGDGITIVEIDFHNPPASPGHCPPQATFVHRLRNDQSAQLLIHYPTLTTLPEPPVRSAEHA